jgi:hypothetical protein
MTKKIIDISAGVSEEGVRAPMPLWLTDTDEPAPCPCGRPMGPHDQWVLATGESGLKRLFHLECIGGGGIIEMDDDDDDDYEEDDE